VQHVGAGRKAVGVTIARPPHLGQRFQQSHLSPGLQTRCFSVPGYGGQAATACY
jgi:hypothetical protein